MDAKIELLPCPFDAWLKSYVGKQDADKMRFSAAELRIAFDAGAATRTRATGEVEAQVEVMFRVASPCFHYAKPGTPDARLWELSETAVMLKTALRKIATRTLATGDAEVERVVAGAIGHTLLTLGVELKASSMLAASQAAIAALRSTGDAEAALSGDVRHD